MTNSLSYSVNELRNILADFDEEKQAHYNDVIKSISNLNWMHLNRHQLAKVAWVYYFFSTQFRENLEVTRSLYPEDESLEELDRGERNTDNLSPWPGVAAPGEKMHHDEFMRRTLLLEPIPESEQRKLEALGKSYLEKTRAADDLTKAMSLASYEDGGLEAVFTAMLTAPEWDGPLLQAFKHFLTEHIRFDSDPEAGHGALCRHLKPDNRILPLWGAFYDMLLDGVPELRPPLRH